MTNLARNPYVVMSVVALAVGVVAFVGGEDYQKYKVSALPYRSVVRTFGNANTYPQRVPYGGETGDGYGRRGGFILGQVTSKSANSLTIQDQNGTTQTITITPSTIITLQTTGSVSDLNTGDSISVSGTQQTDGSIAATTIQKRSTSTSSTGSGTQVE